MCVYFKLKNLQNVTKEGFLFMIQGNGEAFYSRYFFGNMTWRKACIVIGIIQNPNNSSNKYQCALYSSKQLDSVGDIYVDDVSVRRINFRIGISNDRDEVYDNVNVVYQINGYKDNYNLNDFELTTKIKDNNTNKVYYNKETEIGSFFLFKK